MKKIVVSLFLLLNITSLLAQETTYTTKSDIQYYDAATNASDAYINERCVLDLYYPTNIENYPTVVWFHGGGLTGGAKEIPEALKNKGIAVVGVNYRLNPKVKSPKYIEDAAAAVAWVFKNIEGYKGNPSLIFVSGHSAGGYLASMIGLDKSYLAKFNVDANAIAGLIPFSGHAITHFTIRKERGIPGTQPIVDSLAPLYHVRADAPPLLLITGDREMEMLGRYEENAYLMRMMKVAGHKNTTLYEMDGYGHGMTEPAFPLLVKNVRSIVSELNKAKK
ncbi:alpha/beta hydrolase [Galbibacter orientalis]|uniref:Esterase/lipase n=1 Tax=Galbibacter orientalis DSM 19592 TaxID=926559 RepID=I3C403_9FLAO|nr:alpha/beta hydrolase [Galbibacter orientalis]EIJ38346.1 esterase/lipase [Galbibacter orientalis DSM 19592]